MIYHLVEWPESQYFMEICVYGKDIFFDPDHNVWFVSDNKYKEFYND